MEHPVTMFGVSFKQNPRRGQAQVFEIISGKKPKRLNVKLPTGYGKTFTALGSYSILKKQGLVDRMLIIVPTNAQLNQFVTDGPDDILTAGIDGPQMVSNIGYFGVHSLGHSLRNNSQVFAITIQSLIKPTGASIVRDLMQKLRWMVVIDEYHHYGIDAAWGDAVIALPYEHLLAMSATPNRKDNDSAFGKPDITVEYKTAATQLAVKPLLGHSYNYRVDAVTEDGEFVSFTTAELAEEAGGNDPETIERFKISRKMRWSPKYVSPLVAIPIERMLRERIATGYKLQAIVGAMCVSHAEMVCKQIADMFPELRVDWVGTGPNGRADNQSVIDRFCPKKVNGRREPTLDVLVHVGMAGEGLDSVLVSEVIHLNTASRNNSNDQENGRASRYLEGVTGHINFDSGSEYARLGYIGSSIMNAMDDLPPSVEENNETSDPRGEFDYKELPDEPTVRIWDVSLESIDSGDLELMLKVAKELKIANIDFNKIDEDRNDPEMKKIEKLYRNMRLNEAEKHNAESTTRQLRDSVEGAVTSVAGLVIRKMSGEGVRVDKSLRGDIKKRINQRKAKHCGPISNSDSICRTHYEWLKSLESEIIKNGIPEWIR